MKEIRVLSRFFDETENTSDKATKTVLDTLFKGSEEVLLTWVETPKEADVIIVACRHNLKKFYCDSATMIYISGCTKEQPPTDVVVISVHTAMADLVEWLKNFTPKPRPSTMETFKTSFLYISPTGSKTILVVDDKRENLQSAYKQLSQDYHLILAEGYGEAIETLKKQRVDAVLTDCQMPLRSLGSTALSGTSHDVTAQGHVGIFLMLWATAQGIPVAMLTDANHHSDWVVALMETLPKEQTMNGQKILFFNNKEWDVAIKELLD